jgi:signal transduction histidine kinase
VPAPIDITPGATASQLPTIARTTEAPAAATADAFFWHTHRKARILTARSVPDRMDAVALDVAGDATATRWQKWIDIIARRRGRSGGVHPPPGGAGFFDRAIARYGLAFVAVAAATAGTYTVGVLAEKPWAFPFYAAVVVSAWFGVGPGCVAVILASMSVEYLYASPPLSLHVGPRDLPWFASFVLCALVSLTWSTQRRLAQRRLEETVERRTADLQRSNAALQVEIAERRAAEEELRDAEAELARTLRLATLAELAAAIAHEINQPLAAITANGSACVRSLAHQPPMLDNAREAASCIVADGHRAADVIARIRALFNKEEPDQELLDVNTVIEHVLELSRGTVARQQIAVNTEFATSPALVIGDQVQLQQVLVNLVTNALEATAAVEDRPHVLTIRSEAEADGGIRVTVEDTGCGLEPGQLARIFDSFYTTKPDGVGVGLAISRSIIEAHGGTLWATAGSPHGARIGFTLPAAQAE